jgi:hypothetical protein
LGYDVSGFAHDRQKSHGFYLLERPEGLGA